MTKKQLVLYYLKEYGSYLYEDSISVSFGLKKPNKNLKEFLKKISSSEISAATYVYDILLTEVIKKEGNGMNPEYVHRILTGYSKHILKHTDRYTYQDVIKELSNKCPFNFYFDEKDQYGNTFLTLGDEEGRHYFPKKVYLSNDLLYYSEKGKPLPVSKKENFYIIY